MEIAIGSCYEIESQLIFSNDLGFITEVDLENLQSKLLSLEAE
ncbi:four helix bundle protein [Christiangramia oceanisediminis]|nr:four helix bundle protein [Gramella oceanisediminis]